MKLFKKEKYNKDGTLLYRYFTSENDNLHGYCEYIYKRYWVNDNEIGFEMWNYKNCYHI